MLTLLAAVASLLTTQAPVSDSARIDHLAAVGRLWYAARLFHPYLAYKPIDWDSALVAAIPKVSAARNRAEYRAAVAGLLAALGDPATHVLEPQVRGAPSSGEPDPKWRWTDDSILVVSATNYVDLEDWNRAIQRFDSLAKLIPRARGIVIDVRQLVHGDGGPSFPMEQSSFLPALFAAPLAAPGQRTRMHSGYRGDGASSSGGYFSAWVTEDGGTYSGAPNTTWRPIAFVVNERAGPPAEALALQAGGHAALVVEGAPSDAALVSTADLDIGDSLTVQMRLGELVFADGTGGLPADTVVPDSAVAPAVALALVRHPPASRHARPALEPRAADAPQRAYADMTYPTLPYRLLAAFRIWGTFEYFHAYRQLYDDDWGKVLTQFIPRFEAARDSLAYALTVREMVTHTRQPRLGVESRAGGVLRTGASAVPRACDRGQAGGHGIPQ